MRKSKSTPCLHSLQAKPIPIVRQGIKHSTSTQALQSFVMPMPTNMLEEIGFESMIHVPYHTVGECALNNSFPASLLQSDKINDKSYDLATCLATPTEIDEVRINNQRFDSSRYINFLTRIRRQRRTAWINKEDI